MRALLSQMSGRRETGAVYISVYIYVYNHARPVRTRAPWAWAAVPPARPIGPRRQRPPPEPPCARPTRRASEATRTPPPPVGRCSRRILDEDATDPDSNSYAEVAIGGGEEIVVVRQAPRTVTTRVAFDASGTDGLGARGEGDSHPRSGENEQATYHTRNYALPDRLDLVPRSGTEIIGHAIASRWPLWQGSR